MSAADPTARRAAAIAGFLTVWGGDGGYLASDIATSLRCEEADALVELFAAFGDRESADRWLVAHAEGDEDNEDDDHGPTARPDIAELRCQLCGDDDEE